MARLSDKNKNLTFIPNPQSPDNAGFVTVSADDTVPDGWLECNGQAVSRTTYSELFALIGTTYGVGDGSTTFNLPGGDLLNNAKVTGTLSVDSISDEAGTGPTDFPNGLTNNSETVITAEATTSNLGLVKKPKIAKYTRSGNQGIADTATETVVWNAVSINTFGGTPMNTSTGVFTVPTGEAGVYSISSQIAVFEDPSASLTSVSIGLIVNGTGEASSSRTEQNETGGALVEYQRETKAIAATVFLNAGDEVTVTGSIQTSAGASAIFRGFSNLCNVAIAKIG